MHSLYGTANENKGNKAKSECKINAANLFSLNLVQRANPEIIQGEAATTI